MLRFSSSSVFCISCGSACISLLAMMSFSDFMVCCVDFMVF
ncbi:Uncharacterised protein [Serratia marcescens]|nr:Uncharacterised protein [Serratia marcescens]